MSGISLTVETAQLGTLAIPEATATLTEQTSDSVLIEVQTAPTALLVQTAEAVVLEVPAQQGPAGPTAEDAFDTDLASIFLIAAQL